MPPVPIDADWNPVTGVFTVTFDQSLVPSTKDPRNWHVYTPIWHYPGATAKVLGNQVSGKVTRPNMWYGDIGISYDATPPDITNLALLPAAPFDFFPYL